MYSKHVAGARGEDLACFFLVKNGMTVVMRNYRVRGGEIDIIARDGAELVFVEVKLRRTSRYGFPEEAVTRTKLFRICRAIRAYLSSWTGPAVRYRFDVIAIEGSGDGNSRIRHIKNCALPDLF